MGIEKEREAFEIYYIANHHDGDIHPNQQLLEWSGKGEFYFATSVNDLWDMWLAAKQQAVPDGFMAVPIEPTQEMLDATINVPITAVYVDSISGQHKLKVAAYYKAMIQEAQK